MRTGRTLVLFLDLDCSKLRLDTLRSLLQGFLETGQIGILHIVIVRLVELLVLPGRRHDTIALRSENILIPEELLFAVSFVTEHGRLLLRVGAFCRRRGVVFVMLHLYFYDCNLNLC